MEEDPRLATGVFDLLEAPPYRLFGGVGLCFHVGYNLYADVT
jgi:hypothetical protein